MAEVGDVYALQVKLETREKQATLNFHYLELTPPDDSLDTEALAAAWDFANRSSLTGMLSEECRYIGVNVYRRYTKGSARGQYRPPGGAVPGAIAGDSLPASCAIVMKLGQTLFSPESDGQVWIPGIPESVADSTVVSQAHLDGAVQAFIDTLLPNLPEVSPGTGVFRISVLSRKWLDDNPGDWPGATADVVTIGAKATIGTNRLRAQFFRRKKTVVP